MLYELTAPCAFGTEAACAFDFKRIGAENVRAEDGRVLFSADGYGVAAANIHSRVAERILLRLASFSATTFDELFDGVRRISWADFLPKDAAFPVKGSSLSSQLSSVPACQSIVKKAVVEAMKAGHKTQFLPERGEEYRIRFTLRKNQAEIYLDTSGDGLHKRGYRRKAGDAPLKETLAAAMADLARVREDSTLADPFCGSGTLLIESALKALHIAPGLRRHFAAERFAFLPADAFAKAREQAQSEILADAAFSAVGTDIDPEVLDTARDNARKAGVEKYIRFEKLDVQHWQPNPEATVLTNPPYGERLGTEGEAAKLVAILGKRLRQHPVKSAYIITADEAFEQHFGKRADRRRKLYNGMIPTQVYMYFK